MTEAKHVPTCVATEFVKETTEIFKSRYGSMPQVISCGPGRVNLIGEHTDYQGGFVFPMALDLKCVCCCSFNDSGKFRIYSENMKEEKSWETSLPTKPTSGEWHNYAMGTVVCFYEFTKLPLCKGFDMVLNSSVPLGGGVSSSAACEVAVATAMETLNKHVLGPVEKAECVCQKAEHTWAGVPCGLMDQAISVMGQENHAMLFDCKSKVATHAKLSKDLKVIIVDCGIRHKLVDGEYAKRKASCVQAVNALQTKYPSVAFLRDATMDQLDSVKDKIDEMTYRRARHVITECERCLEYFTLLNAGEYEKAGKVMYTAHWSLSKDYEVTIPETDKIVTLATGMPGVVGARQTGGGFGGCVVVLCESEKAQEIMDKVLSQYKSYYAAADHSGTHFSYGEPGAMLVKASVGAHISTV